MYVCPGQCYNSSFIRAQLPQRWHLPFCTRQSSGKPQAPAAETGGRSTGRLLGHTLGHAGTHSCPPGACGRCGAGSAPCPSLSQPPPCSCSTSAPSWTFLGHPCPAQAKAIWSLHGSFSAGRAAARSLRVMPEAGHCWPFQPAAPGGPQAPTQPGHCQHCQQYLQCPQAQAVRCSTVLRAQLFVCCYN